MVQPRKEQVKNLKTRHSRVTYFPAAGDSYTEILDASMYSQVISDTPGGAQEDTKAIIISTGATLYNTILAGDAINIYVDDPNPTLVTFAATDITASRIAATINAAVGFDVALDDEGILVLFSSQSGDDAYITLENSVSGTLSKLGLTAGTYNGVSAPTRGIITTEANIESIGGSDFILRGGFVPLRSGDGRVVTTDASSSSIITVGTNDTYRRIDIPGGMPIHGRVIRNPANTGYWISYYAKMPVEAAAKTFNSDFASLDGTDSLTIETELRYQGPNFGFGSIVLLTVTFPAGPYDRDSTVTRINEVFATDVASGNGNAFIIGTISQPFSLISGDDFKIAVDGGAYQSVGLTGSETTALEIVNKISLLTGVTASVETTTGDNKLIKIQSDETDGTISSLDIQNAGTEYTLHKLGILPGLYRGVFIAEPYGDDEIIIKGLSRGGSSRLEIGGNAATLTRMGLTSGTYYGDNGSEVKVDFPTLDVTTNADAFSYLLVPEIVEYGETDLKVESTLQQFDSNFGVSSGGKGSNTVIDTEFSGKSRGIHDSGKPVTVNALGQIDTMLVRSVRDDLQNVLKKFIIGDFTPGVNSVEKLVATTIQTPGVDGNPGSTSNSLTFVVDPSEAHSNPLVRFQFWRDTGSSIIPFYFEYNTTAHTNFNWGLFLNNAGLATTSGPLRVGDSNIRSAGIATSGDKDLSLTDSAGGRYPRVFELETNATTQPSLIGHTNTKWSVTVGDGTNSFGDFSGADAIEQALLYFDTNVTAYEVCHILIKPGTYTSSGYTLTNNILYVFQGMETGFDIGGDVRRTILEHTGAGALFTQTNGAGGLFLKGITLRKAGTGLLAVDTQTNPVNGEYVYFDDLGIKTQIAGSGGAPPYISLKKCIFGSGTSANNYMTSAIPCVEMEFLFAYGDRNTVFEDCVFRPTFHTPVLRIADDATTVLNTRTGKILFDRCRLQLRSTTNNGSNNLTGNSGALDLSLNNSNGYLTISDIEWRDCVTTTDTGAAKILFYVRTSNGTEWMNIDKFTIKGGSWVAESGVTAFNPFYVGGETYSNDPHINQVNLFDLTLGFAGGSESDYGVVTDEVGGADETGAVCIVVNEWLRVHNVQWNYLTVRSQNPDFYLVSYDGTVDVDGLFLDKGYGESQNYGTPIYRFHIAAFNNNNGYHRIKNLRIRQRDGSLSTNLPASDGAVGIVGWNMTFEECDIGGFNQGAGCPCFRLDENLAQYITFVRCEMIAADYGIYGMYGTTTMYGIKIYNCRINNMTEYGISLMNSNSSHSITEAMINGNHIKNCSTGGIRFAPGTWTSGMTIMNNFIEGTASTNRIRLSETDAINSAAETGANAAGMVQNNNLRGGRLNLIGGPTGGLPPGELWGVACVFRDTEPGAAHNLGVAQWWVINATEMLYNYGDYYNPAK